MTVSLFLDLLLIVLLAATIGFGVVLNRRLRDLRQNHGDFQKLASGFGDATSRAEESVNQLKLSAAALQERIEKAQTLCDDLNYMIDRADGLADRLENDVRAARRHESVRPAAPVPARAANEAPRSQAERHLLHALKMKG